MHTIRNLIAFHRCRICRTAMLSAFHQVCLSCALHADCHRYAGTAADMYRRAQA